MDQGLDCFRVIGHLGVDAYGSWLNVDSSRCLVPPPSQHPVHQLEINPSSFLPQDPQDPPIRLLDLKRNRSSTAAMNSRATIAKPNRSPHPSPQPPRQPLPQHHPQHHSQPQARSSPEAPLVILRVRVISCSNLEAKDRNGLSDPCVRLLVILLTSLC